MISYIRRNHVAFIALFVSIILSGGSVAYAANTIRSSDIVDGQVQNADIAANAVGNGKIQDGSVLGADIKDNALSGHDIKESTLGEVPFANSLRGFTLDRFIHTSLVRVDQTDVCSVPGVWSQCGVLNLTVPPDHGYSVTITSSVTANPGGTAQEVGFCPSRNGVPTCFHGNGEVVTFPANITTNATTSDTRILGPGTYQLSTAVHFGAALPPNAFAHTSTRFDYGDSLLHQGD